MISWWWCTYSEYTHKILWQKKKKKKKILLKKSTTLGKIRCVSFIMSITFHYHRGYSWRKEFAPFGSKFFPLSLSPQPILEAMLMRILDFPLVRVKIIPFWLPHRYSANIVWWTAIVISKQTKKASTRLHNVQIGLYLRLLTSLQRISALGSDFTLHMAGTDSEEIRGVVGVFVFVWVLCVCVGWGGGLGGGGLWLSRTPN